MDFEIANFGVLIITIIVCSSGISAILAIEFEDLPLLPLYLFIATIAFILFYFQFVNRVNQAFLL